jgi:hypothetical protein
MLPVSLGCPFLIAPSVFSKTKTGVRELDIYIFVFVLVGEYACNY